jgi:hypothetical protein
MARSRKTDTIEATDENEDAMVINEGDEVLGVDGIEPTETTDVTEAVEAVAESTDEDTEAGPAFDLTEFEAAIEAAVESRDRDTGTIDTSTLGAVNAAYQALDGAKAKAAARKILSDKMFEAMNDVEMAKAKSYHDVQAGLSAAKSATAGGRERVPADPTEAFVDRVVAVGLAYQLTSLDVPEGVEGNWQDRANAKTGDLFTQAQAYKAWREQPEESRGDAPEIEAPVRAAFRIADGRAAGSRRLGGVSTPGTQVRRNIAEHIKQAMDDVPEGEFRTIAQIRAFKSSEYGDESPSAGAISARLFPGGDSTKCTLVKQGIPVEPVEADGKKGAKRVSA